MYKKLLGHLFLLLAMFAVSGVAAADMLLNRIVVEFEAGGSNREDVEISNRGDEPLFIDVSVLKVTNPGEGENRDPVKNPQKAGFIATPNKLIIPPQGKKTLRLVNLRKDPEQDKIFRVNLKPVAKDFKPETSGVRILVAYQLLVLIPPENVVDALTVKREGKTLRFNNQGNSYAFVSLVRQCPETSVDSEGASCKEQYPAKRVYAGKQWELELPADAPADVVVRVGGQNKTFSL